MDGKHNKNNGSSTMIITTTTIAKSSKLPSLDIIGNKKERRGGHASSLSSILRFTFVVVVLHYLPIPTTTINKQNNKQNKGRGGFKEEVGL